MSWVGTAAGNPIGDGVHRLGRGGVRGGCGSARASGVCVAAVREAAESAYIASVAPANRAQFSGTPGEEAGRIAE